MRLIFAIGIALVLLFGCTVNPADLDKTPEVEQKNTTVFNQSNNTKNDSTATQGNSGNNTVPAGNQSVNLTANDSGNLSINQTNSTIQTQTMLTPMEIAKHKTKADCWIIINKKVYDFSNYDHPGNANKHVPYCGKDGTTVFESSHSQSVKNMIGSFFMGNLNEMCANCMMK